MPNTLLQLQIYPTQPGICKNRPYVPRSKCWTKSCNTMYYCTPRTKKKEQCCPGLLYMFASRPTTIGTPEDRSKSGLFFCSNDMNIERISNLTTTKDGEECIKIKNRTKWIAFLCKNICSINITETEKIKLIKWVKETRITEAQVQALIDDNEWRKSDTLNY
jgi:hypothetical protein